MKYTVSPSAVGTAHAFQIAPGDLFALPNDTAHVFMVLVNDLSPEGAKFYQRVADLKTGDILLVRHDARVIRMEPTANIFFQIKAS